MRSRLEMTRILLDSSYGMLRDHLKELTLKEALFSSSGHRSVLGTLKHTAGWSHVYRSYAFDPEPKHWNQTGWPRGLRDRVEETQEYVDEVIAWLDEGHRLWMTSLEDVAEGDLDGLRLVHWGQRRPLFDIVVMVANHHVYHTGEINELLSIARGEAWEEGEEVEENHLPSVGHRVTPWWMFPFNPGHALGILCHEIRDKTDDEIVRLVIRRGGADLLLNQIFAGICQVLGLAVDDATIGFEVAVRNTSHPFALSIKGNEATFENTTAREADVRLATSAPDLLRLLTGLADPSERRIAVSGDEVLAEKVLGALGGAGSDRS